MKPDAMALCMQVCDAYARLMLKLDDVLGTMHGLGLAEFRLLRALASAPQERLPVAALVSPMGVRLSGVTRQLMPLEKTGQLRRESGTDGKRYAVLLPGGKRAVREAEVTAEAICAEALAEGPAANAAVLRDILQRLCDAPALRL
ncbi:MarR family winged helix-turn-helix transcriptional regulator [Caenimonas aquaedulcis]|uniref:MarR family transcriptional regulator n=1 Tax=Caenimonas aquaedulcis TaxID=2793270 RepID=A0A931H4U5_9BURK|nr:hypothetical protein [Caenimonas aquaedulcis]MBG9388619.1 hypothetical protein [Caenimonas aquaedulcis]